eukprot:TRINITY_DN1058_c1_g3_i1.p1 TRINITY_DN1058_c1_g3~~TRINITY_DN1058_c1_g3_i1.p1  ORF type:complete len:255 (-),score=83.93 TRINITY_DN1058_c1_g3_i1:217-981(-)
MPKAGHFQVKLGGDWKDYEQAEDKILKRAFMAGFPNAKFELRGQHYTYDFKKMVQINTGTGKERDIRQPFGWKQPSKPIVAPGPTMTITVPPGSAGKSIQVPHPKDPSQMITVNVPAKAKAGQAMLVPVPALGAAPAADAPAAQPAAGGGGWSTGAKVGAGLAGAGVVVGGAVLGMAVAEHGIEGTGDIIADAAGDAGAAVSDAVGDVMASDAAGAAGDALADAGDHIGDFAADAGEFVVDAADTAGDFIMDLF